MSNVVKGEARVRTVEWFIDCKVRPVMKAQYFALLSLTACLDSQGSVAESPDEAQGSIVEEALAVAPISRITISADAPPALIVFREGANGSWRPATQVTPQTFHARVRGAFTVLAVCPDLEFPRTQLISRVPADGVVEVFCTFPDAGPEHQVVGSMVEPGSVSFASSRRTSAAPNWRFQVPVSAGTYDLVASNADRVAVRRNIAVNGDITLPAVDLAQEGTALLANPITLTNPVPGEQSEAVVFLMTPGTDPQAQISRGLPANAKIAPDSVLAAGEDQEVSVRSTFNDGITSILRSARRSIRSGGNSVFTLRPLLAGLAYTINNRGELVVSWSSGERVDFLTFSASDAAGRSISLDVTAGYLAATGQTRLTLTTNVPGYQPEWKLDFVTDYYFRDTFAQTFSGGTVPGERWGLTISELVNWPAAAAAGSAKAAAPVAPRGNAARARRASSL